MLTSCCSLIATLTDQALKTFRLSKLSNFQRLPFELWHTTSLSRPFRDSRFRHFSTRRISWSTMARSFGTDTGIRWLVKTRTQTRGTQSSGTQKTPRPPTPGGRGPRWPKTRTILGRGARPARGPRTAPARGPQRTTGNTTH